MSLVRFNSGSCNVMTTERFFADRAARKAARAEAKVAKAEAKVAKAEAKLEAKRAKLEAAKRIHEAALSEAQRLGVYSDAAH